MELIIKFNFENKMGPRMHKSEQYPADVCTSATSRASASKEAQIASSADIVHASTSLPPKTGSKASTCVRPSCGITFDLLERSTTPLCGVDDQSCVN